MNLTGNNDSDALSCIIRQFYGTWLKTMEPFLIPKAAVLFTIIWMQGHTVILLLLGAAAENVK